MRGRPEARWKGARGGVTGKWVHARKRNLPLRHVELGCAGEEGSGPGPRWKGGKGPVPLGFSLDFLKKRKYSRDNRFLRDFGEKEKHIKICVELKGIFLILQNWFEPI